MGKETKISWCDATWNCWQGCTKVAPECANCYAEREMLRWGKEPHKIVRSKDATFYAPLKWKEPRRIFVCSWSDFFHEDVDPSWRDEAWNIIASKPTHTFIILTKRPQNIPAMLPRWDWPSAFQNIWFLVSAGTNESLTRFWPVLRDIPGLAVRGISMEPLLERVTMTWFYDFCDPAGPPPVMPDWIIVSGESGPGRRPMDLDWARAMQKECAYWHVPFFYKGTIGNVHTLANEMLDGKVYHEFPEVKRLEV